MKKIPEIPLLYLQLIEIHKEQGRIQYTIHGISEFSEKGCVHRSVRPFVRLFLRRSDGPLVRRCNASSPTSFSPTHQ